MSQQRSFWFCVQFTKQLKQDNVGHREVIINNVATVRMSPIKTSVNLMYQFSQVTRFSLFLLCITTQKSVMVEESYRHVT